MLQNAEPVAAVNTRWRRAHRLLMVGAVFAVLLATCDRSLGQQDRGPSDPLALLGYVSIVRYNLMDILLEKCQSQECSLLKAIDDVFQSDQAFDVGRSFPFASQLWSVDTNLVGTIVGSRQAAGNSGSAVFVTYPINIWDGDLLLITSSPSPQNVSIVRIGDLRLSGRPTLSVLYDSLRKPFLLGTDAVPLGGIAEINVKAAGRLLITEEAILGSRSPKTGRRVELTITPMGIQVRLDQ